MTREREREEKGWEEHAAVQVHVRTRDMFKNSKTLRVEKAQERESTDSCDKYYERMQCVTTTRD